MAGTVNLLSQAGREVQAADQLLTVTYPLSGDPRMLLGAMRHGCNAIELAAQALVLHDTRAQTPAHIEGEEAIAQLKSLLSSKLKLPEGERAVDVRNAFRERLRRYEESPTAFARKERLVVASEEFSSLDAFGPHEVGDGVKATKAFVYVAGKHVMVGDAQ